MIAREAYWKTHLRYMAFHVLVWFLAGFLLSILLVEPLNRWRLGGIPLGFWFAMQGGIIIYVVQMFVYNRQMNRLDAKYGQEERDPS